MRVRALVLIFVALPWLTSAALRLRRENRNARYIFSCRTTDFECFKRQYRSLRDHYLISGNMQFAIEPYHPYTFKNSVSKTCVQLSGLEDSRLTGIQMDSIAKEFLMTLEMPFKIQQVNNNTANCLILDGKKTATIQVTYPFQLIRKKGDVHMSLSDENLDVVLDIPDMSQHKHGTAVEQKLYELSEWAYTVVQNVDASQFFALPYTNKLRIITEFVPFDKFIDLYPFEEYLDINFKHSDLLTRCNGWKDTSLSVIPKTQEFPGKAKE